MMTADNRYSAGRRREDLWIRWLPLILSLLTTLVTLTLNYGKQGGRLDLIEYRLHKIELKLGDGQ